MKSLVNSINEKIFLKNSKLSKKNEKKSKNINEIFILSNNINNIKNII